MQKKPEVVLPLVLLSLALEHHLLHGLEGVSLNVGISNMWLCELTVVCSLILSMSEYPQLCEAES